MFQDVNLGPCEVWGGTNIAAAAKLCDTAEGLNLTYDEEYAMTYLDKTGTRSRGKYVSGGECKATGAAGEVTLAQLASLTGQDADSGNTRLALNARVGKNIRSDAQVVILKPKVEETVSADAADWIYIPAATFEVNWNLPFTINDQRNYGFTIEGHPVTAEEVASGGRISGDGFVEGNIIVLGD